MAAKGSIAKEELIKKLLEVIPNSFQNEKEIRVDVIENGNPVQIKITLTAVKSPISNNPEMQIINEEQFFITEEENIALGETLKEMGEIGRAHV